MAHDRDAFALVREQALERLASDESMVWLHAVAPVGAALVEEPGRGQRAQDRRGLLVRGRPVQQHAVNFPALEQRRQAGVRVEVVRF